MQTEKKVLIFQGGWDGHEPKLVSARYKRMLEKHGYDVTITFSHDAENNVVWTENGESTTLKICTFTE